MLKMFSLFTFYCSGYNILILILARWFVSINYDIAEHALQLPYDTFTRMRTTHADAYALRAYAESYFTLCDFQRRLF